MIEIRTPRIFELQRIVAMEKEIFPGYSHAFGYSDLEVWFGLNPGMFFVFIGNDGKISGYSTIVPVTSDVHHSLIKGEISALNEFPRSGVLYWGDETNYFHIEVIASIGSKKKRAAIGSLMLMHTSRFLANNAKFVTASPVTEIGDRLCNHFGFSLASFSNDGYPIVELKIEKTKMAQRIKKLEDDLEPW